MALEKHRRLCKESCEVIGEKGLFWGNRRNEKKILNALVQPDTLKNRQNEESNRQNSPHTKVAYYLLSSVSRRHSQFLIQVVKNRRSARENLDSGRVFFTVRTYTILAELHTLSFERVAVRRVVALFAVCFSSRISY